MDGQLKVSYRGKVLTPGEAPPLAAELRDLGAFPLPAPVYEPEEPEKPEVPPLQPQIRRMWYEDSELRRLHGEQAKAGNEDGHPGPAGSSKSSHTEDS